MLGALLLCLPFASRSGESCGFLTALFTSTSATCVTGLSLVDTYTQWSGFGQLVLLILIQVGGLGFMTVVSIFYLVLKAKIGMKNRMLLAQSFGVDDIEGIVLLVRQVIKGTVLFEGLGAVILTIRFCFDQPFWTALRWGIFHSVSAFCNAGFDLFGAISPGMSMAPYAQDYVVNLVFMALIVVGGLGFVVWRDLACYPRRKHLKVYTKLVLMITGALIAVGWLAYALLEWDNPATLGSMPTDKKLLAALFQSVTTRTAGFAAIPQNGLREASKGITWILMLIGGSSGSTAGGIKTVTMGVAFLGAFASLRGKTHVTVFHRNIDRRQIANAMSIVFMMVLLVLATALYLCAACGINLTDALYETASAMGTVGLTAGGTAMLDTAGKLLVIALMFFGRTGIATIGVGLMMGDRNDDRFQYAAARILIG